MVTVVMEAATQWAREEGEATLGRSGLTARRGRNLYKSGNTDRKNANFQFLHRS
jgi:hypothetical protein